jgi:hypothetical protein
MVVAVALATFAVVTTAVTLGMSELVRSCAYVMTPNSVCGLGVCSGPLVCGPWSPDLILGPCIGLLAGLGSVYPMVSAYRRRRADTVEGTADRRPTALLSQWPFHRM